MIPSARHVHGHMDICLCAEQTKPLGTESGVAIAGEGETGRGCLVGMRFPCQLVKMFWDSIIVIVAQHWECINGPELCTLK